MNVAHDVYAEINPAFCAVVLADFCEAHYKQGRKAPALVTAYAVLPITLSEELADTFDGTNKNTGLLVWLYRNPTLLTGLSVRINDTLQVTTDAIRFGCTARILRLNHDGSLLSMHKKFPKSLNDGTPNRVFKRAALLGNWFAGTGSARAVIEALGVTV